MGKRLYGLVYKVVIEPSIFLFIFIFKKRAFNVCCTCSQLVWFGAGLGNLEIEHGFVEGQNSLFKYFLISSCPLKVF